MPHRDLHSPGDLHSLSDFQIAVLVAPGFDEDELLEPVRALVRAGASPVLVAHRHVSVRGRRDGAWNSDFIVDQALDETSADEFDALVLPGEERPDTIRNDDEAMAFIRGFVDVGKPVAAIGRGPWALIDTPWVRGRRLTSSRDLRPALVEAGARWVDEAVVIDGPLITGQGQDSLDLFCRTLVHTLERRAAAGVRPRPQIV